MNKLHWSPNPGVGTTVVGYIIFRNGVEIAEVGPTTFHYEDHNVKKGATNVYGVAAIDASGTLSPVATVVIK